MDIVPTLEQWRSFANPIASAAYYHWPFLATKLAPTMIEHMGGRYWVDANLNKMKGQNDAGLAKFKENDAWEHYCHQFSNPECIAGSCADYESGATGEPKEQESDQKDGKKVEVPLMVLFSATYLGRMHDVPAIWQNWVNGELTTHAIQDGYSHFFPEEAPDVAAKHIIEWIDHVGV